MQKRLIHFGIYSLYIIFMLEFVALVELTGVTAFVWHGKNWITKKIKTDYYFIFLMIFTIVIVLFLKMCVVCNIHFKQLTLGFSCHILWLNMLEG